MPATIDPNVYVAAIGAVATLGATYINKRSIHRVEKKLGNPNGHESLTNMADVIEQKVDSMSEVLGQKVDQVDEKVEELDRRHAVLNYRVARVEDKIRRRRKDDDNEDLTQGSI